MRSTTHNTPLSLRHLAVLLFFVVACAVPVQATTAASNKASDVKVALSVQECNSRANILITNGVFDWKPMCVQYFNIEVPLKDLLTTTLGCHSVLSAKIQSLIDNKKPLRIMIGLKSPRQQCEKCNFTDSFRISFSLFRDMKKGILGYSVFSTTMLVFQKAQALQPPQSKPYPHITQKIYLEDLYAAKPLMPKSSFLPDPVSMLSIQFPYPDEFVVHFRPLNQVLGKRYKKAFKIALAGQSTNAHKTIRLQFKGKFLYNHSVASLRGALKRKFVKFWGLELEDKYLFLRFKTGKDKKVDISKAQGRLVKLLKKHKPSPDQIMVYYQVLYYPQLLIASQD